MSFTQVEPALFRGGLNPRVGSLRDLWREFGADVIVGHPCFRNIETIGRQLREGIGGAEKNFDVPTTCAAAGSRRQPGLRPTNPIGAV